MLVWPPRYKDWELAFRVYNDIRSCIFRSYSYLLDACYGRFHGIRGCRYCISRPSWRCILPSVGSALADFDWYRPTRYSVNRFLIWILRLHGRMHMPRKGQTSTPFSAVALLHAPNAAPRALGGKEARRTPNHAPSRAMRNRSRQSSSQSGAITRCFRPQDLIDGPNSFSNSASSTHFER